MIITVQPSDIIKRCLWSEYKRFCLKDKSNDDIRKLIEENQSVILSEEDAFVIGLLKIVETTNLVHRFNQHMDEFLKIKSTIYGGKLFIIKNTLIKEVSSFRDRFPDEFKAGLDFKIGMEELFKHLDIVSIEIDKLSIYPIEVNDKKFNCVLSNSAKELFC